MDLTLTNIDFTSNGIFGRLEDKDDTIELYTLQHAFPVVTDPMSASTTYMPIIKPGQYKCIRGQHCLPGMIAPFETFEITDVPGHTGLLFHCGNFNKDSEGCILLGLERDHCKDILNSRAAFEVFMKAQDGINEFLLTVV